VGSTYGTRVVLCVEEGVFFCGLDGGTFVDVDSGLLFHFTYVGTKRHMRERISTVVGRAEVRRVYRRVVYRTSTMWNLRV